MEQINSELEDFTYSASHDLQEPLRKILLFGDLIKVSDSLKLGETELDYLSRMQKAALNLIEDLLGYSQLAHRGFSFENLGLAEITEEVIDDLEVQIISTKEAFRLVNFLPLKRIRSSCANYFKT